MLALTEQKNTFSINLYSSSECNLYFDITAGAVFSAVKYTVLMIVCL